MHNQSSQERQPIEDVLAAMIEVAHPATCMRCNPILGEDPHVHDHTGTIAEIQAVASEGGWTFREIWDEAERTGNRAYVLSCPVGMLLNPNLH